MKWPPDSKYELDFYIATAPGCACSKYCNALEKGAWYTKINTFTGGKMTPRVQMWTPFFHTCCAWMRLVKTLWWKLISPKLSRVTILGSGTLYHTTSLLVRFSPLSTRQTPQLIQFLSCPLQHSILSSQATLHNSNHNPVSPKLVSLIQLTKHTTNHPPHSHNP